MNRQTGWTRSCAVAGGLALAVGLLIALLAATDRRLRLDRHASTRYQFHAIPVAVSVLYHGRPHDYAAYRDLALRFQDVRLPLDLRIAQAVGAERDPGAGTYFWTADDRGLADYVLAAFRLFGPRTRSLSRFWFVLLGLTVGLYVVGYWRYPAVWLGPVGLVFGWLTLAQVLPCRVPLPFPAGWWGEELALYESRLFDGLALIAVLHLGLLTVGRRAGRAAWLTALPQALLLVGLYHCRSSLGWQYLALFVLAGGRLAGVALRRLPGGALWPPVAVALLLAGSLAGLRLYQHVAYHPDYRDHYGRRTFWHNALMGLAYHPGLRAELPTGCDDGSAIDCVLRRMRQRDPDLDPAVWNRDAALNSLGGHAAFDWDAYEAAARSVYWELWRERPADLAACYAVSKPASVVRQVATLAGFLAQRVLRGEAAEWLVGLAVVLAAVAGLGWSARSDSHGGEALARLTAVVLVLLPFSLIPGLAFYPAVPTLAAFFLLVGTLAGLLSGLVVVRRVVGRCRGAGT